MEIKKINDYLFKIPKSGKMNVPVEIYASEKLLEKIKGDRSLQQGKNVASLPGIVKKSIMLPDAHQGYGFSIGGVAGFSYEDGIITPGGIGFDINCLPKNSKILTKNGYYKKIQSFESDFIEIDNKNSEYELKSLISKQSLISFDSDEKTFTSKTPAFFMKKRYNQDIKKIKTKLGYTVQATKDHPVLTKNGMTVSGNLKKNDEIAVHPFKGVEYKNIEQDKILVNEKNFTPQQKTQLKKRNLLPFNLKNDKLAIITKLFGYLLGDGSIYISENKGFINAYGPKQDLKEIKKDFKNLGFSARIYSRKKEHSIPTRYGVVEFTNKNYELHVSSVSLAKLFFELGYPNGEKTITPFSVPDWIMESPLWIKRLFLSGLFGAELSTPRTHTKTGFDCPTLSINKNSVLLENVRKYSIQIMALLDEFGINTHKLLQSKNYVNKYGPTHRLKIQISSEETNLLNLWEKIGYSYNKKREIRSQIAILYIKKKKNITKKRTEIAVKCKKLKTRGLKLNEVQDLLSSPITNKRFIERHYYEDAGQRIPQKFPSFRKYVREKSAQRKMHGCFYDKIQSIESIEYDDLVYDFNIPKTHNFIADNVVVSNCGVRLLTSNLEKKQVTAKIEELLNTLFRNVSSGVGSESKIRLSNQEMRNVLENGVKWAVKNKYGYKDDINHCESRGSLDTADSSKVSKKAFARGRKQLGTLGAGNHFLEVQYVDEIYDPESAKAMGIKQKGQVTVMIHCGSRGFGHQVCSDYLRKMEDAYPDVIKNLPEKNLIYAKFESRLGQDYFKAMSAAANYAWANRHVIAHFVRSSFKPVLKDPKLKTVYDVAHNIAKIEEHEINGNTKKLIVHRKGATRAFPPNHPETPETYRSIGQPVIIPGSMGTASYVLTGTKEGMQKTWGSAPHGAGRLMSRHAAKKKFRAEKVKNNLRRENIFVKAASWRGIAEESPGVYKDIDEVVKVAQKSGIAKPAARLRPIGVIKG
ncbi:RNA-splicing ligase RtcB [Candidatus Woesearchaeota archaeon]|nr:RNA-splicing ligase RtcB [Candidatus Woesearchaeota archaeon]